MLYAINHTDSPASVRFDLSELRFRPRAARLATLWADSPFAHNSTANRDAIRLRTENQTVPGDAAFALAAPPYPVTQALLE